MSVDTLELLDTQSTRRDLVAAGAAAVGFDLAVRSGVACLAGALVVTIVAVGLATSGRLANPQARAAAAAAPVFAFFLVWRDSPWLLLPDLAAAGGLLLVAASFARGGSIADVPGGDIVARSLRSVGHAFAAPAFLLDALPRRRQAGNRDAVVRGVLLAVPLVLVLGLLLSSADAVFASLFRVPLDPGSLTLHLVLAGIGAWGMAALSFTAAAGTAGSTGTRPRLGTVETTVILGALVALYAAFAVSQLVVAVDGAQHVLRTADLTYAEYARNGFFQLLAVAALTLLLLPALDNGERVVRMLSGAAAVLTLVIVGVALRRLSLYQAEFGLTMLRLYSTVFAVWVGAVFVLLGCRLLGLGGARRWLLPAGAAMGLAMLLVLNLMNPEAMVVRHNAGLEKRWDPWYLVSLSDDAVPALAQTRMPEVICSRPVPIRPRRTGWAGWNRSHQRADDLRSKVCGSTRAQA